MADTSDPGVADAHAMAPGDVAAALEADTARGLDRREVAERRARFGTNQLRAKEPTSLLTILRHQFRSIIVWLLVAAALLALFLNDHVEAAAIAVVLILNGAIGFASELRAARSMEALLRIAQVSTRVRREGKAQLVDARDIVPGDIVLLEAGDVVTADVRLLSASNLQSNESVLTGESSPVEKRVEAVAENAPLGERSSMVFKGAAITRGSAEGIVTATGMATEVGRISALVQKADASVAPLERRLDRLGHRLVWLTLGLAALTIGLGVLQGHEITAMVQTGVALAVAAVPEGLPVVATLCLARGMWRMAARNAVITNLSSVETLGATTAIMTDKTGTLTENRMTVVRYLLPGRDVEADWSGERLRFSADGRGLEVREDAPLAWALRIGALCNTAEASDGPHGAGSADPMEAALLSAAEAAGLGEEARADYTRVTRHAFDPDLKMMATVHRDDGACLVAVKGAPEAVLDACDREATDSGDRPIGAAEHADWHARIREAAGEGLRLLALAMKRTDDAAAPPYEGLTLVGFVCLLDPLREDVPDAIRASLRAGLKVVVLTGDHATTAETIARAAGLGANGIVVREGAELAGFEPATADAETVERLLGTDVFARVAPDTKLKLVALYQANGHIIAMTGDGVNDAPALKKADIGIAMGQRGTQVAREAADMILKDDAFGTIIAAMRQGREIYDNIRRFVVYLMSCNVSEVLVVGLAVGLGLPAPLLPLQILFLNLVTDVFPAFALGFGRGDEGIMERPPRPPGEAIVDRPQWLLIGLLGTLITLVTLGAFALALFRLELPPAEAVTVAFLTLALAQLWNVFNMRAPASGWLRNEITGNGYVWAALALCLGLIGAVTWVPALAAILHLPDPGPAGLALAGGMSLASLLAGQILVSRMPQGQRGAQD